MKKVLILCLHRPNRAPSQRFRFEQYLSFLENNGYSFDFSYLLNEIDDKYYYLPGKYLSKTRIVLYSTLKRLVEIVKAKNYDLIFVQREAYMLGTAFFEKVMSKKIPMIFDFDDSIWLQYVLGANKKFAFLKKAAKTSKIIESSNLIFAGNQYLADYAKYYNKNVVIIPTTIDTDVYRLSKGRTDHGALCIGWSGSFSTIQHFLYAIPVLKRIKEKYGVKVRFKIIGDSNYYCKELETQALPWKAETELLDLSDIDIGIMPLPDDEWAKGKCGLKGLQYMSIRVPTLMSPVGVNSTIIQNGINGYLPANEEDWIHYLSLLIEDSELRKKIGEMGRQTILDKYSVKAWKAKYLEYFNQMTSKN
jgi:glycosyltransferase involved in cell wall biosynthesis